MELGTGIEMVLADFRFVNVLRDADRDAVGKKESRTCAKRPIFTRLANNLNCINSRKLSENISFISETN